MSVLDLSDRILNRQVGPLKVVYWLIDGYDGAYCIGSDASLWSKKVKVGWTWIVGTDDDWHLMNPTIGSRGYLVTRLCHNGVETQVRIHQLVAEYFIPKPLLLPNIEVCHEDGVRHNSQIYNLRWDTHESNQADRIRHGTATFMKGEQNGMAMRTWEEIDTIRTEHAQGMTYKEIAQLHAVTPGYVGRIVRKDRWVR